MIREQQIDSLAAFLVSGLVSKGIIKPKGDAKDIIALVVEFLSANFEAEAQIDAEADRTAEDLARKNPGIDVTRMRNLTRQKLAEVREQQEHAVSAYEDAVRISIGTPAEMDALFKALEPLVRAAPSKSKSKRAVQTRTG